MKTLIFLDYFTPAFKAGGPIRIFEAVARAAHNEHRVAIVTQDRDWGENQPMNDVTPNTWQHFENADVFYADHAHRSLTSLRQLIETQHPEAVHLNSLFSRTWTMKALFLNRMGRLGGARLFLSPHGELADSALTIKGTRKKVFLLFGKCLGLFKGITWIATSKKEIDEIRRHMGAKTRILLSVPPPPPVHMRASSNKKAGALRLVFLARLSAMKNIDFLFKILPRLKGRIDFHVYGPVDPEYATKWNSLIARAAELGPGVRFEYHGPVSSSLSLATLAEYDAFVQPSLSENFGFSILEALACGTPAIISDRTPWNEINDAKIGAALPLEDEEKWVKTLQLFIDMSDEAWRGWSTRAQEWIRSRGATGRELLEIYEQGRPTRT